MIFFMTDLIPFLEGTLLSLMLLLNKTRNVKENKSTKCSTNWVQKPRNYTKRLRILRERMMKRKRVLRT
jgi:hypothetical protein